VVLTVISILAFINPHIVGDPDAYNSNLIDPTFSRPIGPWGGISMAHPLGVEPVTGRDVLSRVVNGARVSLLIAFLATALAVSIGVVMGIIAGFFGGWLDAIIARTMDVFLAFPLLVFAIALVGVVPSSAFGLNGNSLRVGLLIFVIGFFAWPYMGRIIRGQTLSLREREFVDAARSLGAGGPYILFRELLPNLVAPILVYSTLLIPVNILFEAALSYLGVGIIPPTPSWGGDAVGCGQQRLLLCRPHVHDHSRPGYLLDGHGVQPLRRRAARRPGSAKRPVGRHSLRANTPQQATSRRNQSRGGACPGLAARSSWRQRRRGGQPGPVVVTA